MRPFISLLLIPMLLVGHALPHSHSGSGIVVPDKRAHRPHIHLGIHHHHHDGDKHDHHLPDNENDGRDQGSHVDSTTDHDSDAVYLADCDLAGNRMVDGLELDFLPAAWISVDSITNMVSGRSLRAGDPPDRPIGALPVYLLTATFRL